MDDPIDTQNGSGAQLSHLRLIVIMGVVAVAGSVLGYIFASAKFGVGFGIGGLLSFVNYYWMKYSLKSVFEEAEEGERPRLGVGKYLFRYLVFGTFLFGVYLIDWRFLVPLIFGLSSFAFAVVIEGILRIFIFLFNRKGI